MTRPGSFALLLIVAVAAVLTLWLGPRPVRELWYAEELSEARIRELFPEGLTPPSPGEGTLAFARQLAAADGIPLETLPRLANGAVLLDADNDGDLDAISPQPADEDVSVGTCAGPLRVWWNDENRSFREVGSLLGPAVTAPRRLDPSSAAPLRPLDADRDGRVDLILALAGGRQLILWNRLAPRSFLRLRLVASASPSPTAVTRVEVTAAGREQVRLAPWGGAGRHGAVAEVHFGLGDAERVARIEITWPSGHKSALSDLAARKDIEVVEPAVVEPEAGDGEGALGG